MEPPEGCPPLAGRKRHACHSPPQPVFCPDRPRPLDPGRTAKPHYTVPDRTGAQGLPGRGTRGGVADPSPVRQPAGSSRRMPRFGASREDPRKARAPIRLVWGQTDAAFDPSPVRQPAGSSRRMRDLGLRAACGGWPRNARCGSQSGLKAREAKGVVLVWNPKRRAPFRILCNCTNKTCLVPAIFVQKK